MSRLLSDHRGRFRVEIDKIVEGRRVRVRRLLPRDITKDQAQAIAEKLERKLLMAAALVEQSDGWDAYVDSLSEAPKSWLYATVQNCKHRARSKGIECSLSAAQLKDVLRRSRGRCEVTGLRFTTDRPSGSRTRPYFHSLDRIDSAKGYTIDNIRIVCHATNIALNTWGEDVFAELARGFVFTRYSASYAVERPGS